MNKVYSYYVFTLQSGVVRPLVGLKSLEVVVGRGVGDLTSKAEGALLTLGGILPMQTESGCH